MSSKQSTSHGKCLANWTSVIAITGQNPSSLYPLHSDMGTDAEAQDWVFWWCSNTRRAYTG